jgi:hypothetical protein
MHCTAPPPPLSEVRPDLPERLVQGVLRAMSKDPAARFDSVVGFLTAIGGRRPPQAPQPRISIQVSEAATERLPVSPARPRRYLPLLAGAGLGAVATWTAMSFTPLGQWLQLGRDAATAAADPPGHVWINADPWGQVYIDGDSVGRTPVFNLTIGAGTHLLRIQKAGYLPLERQFEVAPGQQLRLTNNSLQRAP